MVTSAKKILALTLFLCAAGFGAVSIYLWAHVVTVLLTWPFTEATVLQLFPTSAELQYTQSGVTHTTWVFSPDLQSQWIADNLPLGSKHKISIDPNNVSYAEADVGVNWPYLRSPFISLVIALVFAFTGAHWWKKTSNPVPNIL